MKKLVLASALMLVMFNVQAREYECKVYCKGGSIWVTVDADSSSNAAEKIDPTPVANGLCQDAGKGNASSSTMSSNQCSAR